jgi:hypothetical protein
MRDENIKQGNTELDTETLHGLQIYLIVITWNGLNLFLKI